MNLLTAPAPDPLVEIVKPSGPTWVILSVKQTNGKYQLVEVGRLRAGTAEAAIASFVETGRFPTAGQLVAIDTQTLRHTATVRPYYAVEFERG